MTIRSLVDSPAGAAYRLDAARPDRMDIPVTGFDYLEVITDIGSLCRFGNLVDVKGFGSFVELSDDASSSGDVSCTETVPSLYLCLHSIVFQC